MSRLLRTMAADKRPLDADRLAEIRAWLDEDWESHDIDRDVVRLIDRLVGALEARLK